MAAPKGNQYAKGHGKGRPKTWDDDAISDMANRLRTFIAEDRGIYLNSFCVQEKINAQCMSEWAAVNKDFAEALSEAKHWQEQKFITKSLTKEWDGGFAKYVMARVCGDQWKASFDQPKDERDAQPTTVIINKIEK